MEMTQMNTRIPVDLKKQGDEVLSRFGKTASDVMRSVWAYMAEKQDLPACAKEAADDAEIARKRAAMRKAQAIVPNLLATLGIENTPACTYDEMREAMYAEMLEGYEALNG